MTLPPGFRFHPTDEELVAYYLKKRVKNIPIEFDVIADVDLYKCEPWDLPEKSRLPSSDSEWFFFSPRDRKYPNGARTNRATEAGYWKATGRDRFVKTGPRTIGMKKTLVFYLGRAPHGERTDWLMHEYRLDGDEWEATNVSQDAYVLCRVFKKNGFIPGKNNQNGLDEQVDSADSPSEERNSVFMDNDVKPSLVLPPPPPSANQPTQVAKSLAESLEAVPLAVPLRTAMPLSVLPVALPLTTVVQAPPTSGTSAWGDFDNFDYSDSFPQIENTGSFDDLMTGFPFLEDVPDFSGVPPIQPTTPDPRSEFSKQWQQINADNMVSEFMLSETPTYQKYEDSTASKFAMLPITGSDHLDELDLPPLKDSPSPPTQYPPSCSDESSGVIDFQPSPTTIQIRSRPVNGMIARSTLPYTAKHRILYSRTKKSPAPKVKEEKPKVSELEQTTPELEQTSEVLDLATSEEEVSKPEKTPEIADGVHEVDANASSALVAPESEEADVGIQKSADTVVETVTSAEIPSESAQPSLSQPSTVPQETSDILKDTEAAVPSSSLPTEIDRQVVESDHLMKPSADVGSESEKFESSLDDRKSVTSGVYHLKGYGELPRGIRSIHVNAVTICCSCDKVSAKPHVQATVCDCYNSSKVANSRVLQEPLGQTEEQGPTNEQSWEKRRGGIRKTFACVFLMGVVSACLGFFAFQGVWRVGRQFVGDL